MAMQMKYELSDESIFNANYDHVVRLYLCYLTKHEIKLQLQKLSIIQREKDLVGAQIQFFSSIYHSCEGIL